MNTEIPGREWFVMTNSKAAPFFSDTDMRYVKAETANEALGTAMAEYKHPCGLYAIGVFDSADAYHHGAKPVATWCYEEVATEA